jgi:hypothetical protein
MTEIDYRATLKDTPPATDELVAGLCKDVCSLYSITNADGIALLSRLFRVEADLKRLSITSKQEQSGSACSGNKGENNE